MKPVDFLKRHDTDSNERIDQLAPASNILREPNHDDIAKDKYALPLNHHFLSAKLEASPKPCLKTIQNRPQFFCVCSVLMELQGEKLNEIIENITVLYLYD